MATPAKRNPFLSGLLVGLFAGLGLAVVVALLITRSNPFVSPPPQGNAGPSGKNGSPTEAPRYEFDAPLAEGTATGTPAAESTGYFLQAGAFRNAADADQLKARLALLGFEARVLYSASAETPLHKVQLGPYRALDELNSARSRLTQSGVQTILIKIPPQAPTQIQEKP
jgi:cell division protein FtsN